jgi:hypothetical protein
MLANLVLHEAQSMVRHRPLVQRARPAKRSQCSCPQGERLVDHQILQARSELLRRMNADDFARLQPHLESVFLELRTPTADRKIEAVYFLESG